VHGAAGTGKTHLVYVSIIRALLHPRDVHLQHNSAAVLFDMDYTFDPERLFDLLLEAVQTRMAVHSPESQANECIAHAESCMQRLFVFRPTSTLQLAVTVSALPMHMSIHAPHLKLSLVAVDTLSGLLYWPDRYTHTSTERQRNTSNQKPHPVRLAMQALERLRVEFHVALIIGHSLRSTNTQSFAQGTADIRTGTPSQITAPTETWGAGLSSTPHSIDSATISLGRPLGSESDPTQSSGVVPSNQSKTFRADLTPVSVPAMPIDSDLEELVFIQAASQGASSASSGRPSNAIIHRNAVLRSSNNATPFLLQIGAGSVRTVLDDRQPEG
jgi:hypothetical protein